MQPALPTFSTTVAVATGAPGATRQESLDGIDTTLLTDGALAWVQGGPAASTLFRLDTTSAAVPNGTTIIAPLTGPGRWLALAGGSGGAATILQAAYQPGKAPGQLQTIAGAGLTPIEDGTGTATPITALLANSVQSTSIIRAKFFASQASPSAGSAPFGGFFRVELFFPDDAIPDLRIPRSADFGVPFVALNFSTSVDFNVLYPLSATAAFGGPPTGRVGIQISAGNNNAGDSFRIGVFPEGSTWGDAYIGLEELDGSPFTIFAN